MITKAASLPPPSRLERACLKWMDYKEPDIRVASRRDDYKEAVELLPHVRASIAEINGLLTLDYIAVNPNFKHIGHFINAAYNFCTDEEVAVYDLDIPVYALGSRFVGTLVNRGVAGEHFGNSTKLLINVGDVSGGGFGNGSLGVVINAGSLEHPQPLKNWGIFIDVSGTEFSDHSSYSKPDGKVISLLPPRMPGIIYNPSPELESYVLRLVDLAKTDPWSIPDELGDTETIVEKIKRLVQ
jgi:hypothetical protein